MAARAAHTFASRARRSALAVALALLAAGLSACGSSDDGITIPNTNSEQLLADLTQVQTASDNQDCEAATSAAEAFVADVNLLPKEVGTEAKDALRSAGEHLVDLTKDCTPPTGTSDTFSTPEPTTSTATTATTSTSTSTSTSTTTSTPEENPGEGNGAPGGGNAGGEGGGSGGGSGGNGGSGGIGGDE